MWDENLLADCVLPLSTVIHRSLDPSIPCVVKCIVCVLARIQGLETMFAQQEERLQPYMSRRFFAKPIASNTDTLLGRVEVLEQGMDLLLNAQVGFVRILHDLYLGTSVQSCCSPMITDYSQLSIFF